MEKNNKKKSVTVKCLIFGLLFFSYTIFSFYSANAAEVSSKTGDDAAGDKPENKEELKKKQEEDTYVYSFENKRDPFRSLLLGKMEKESSWKRRRRKKAERRLTKVPFTPLQRFELSSLKLTAIILGSRGKFALIEAPDGKGYTVKKGTFLGKSRGIIKKIKKDRIVVNEKYIDMDDTIKTRIVELKLKPAEE